MVTYPQTNPQRPPARCKQTGPITIHCAAKFSAQCDDVERRNDVTDDAQHRDGDAVLLLQRRKCAVGGGGTWKTLKSSSSVANFNSARRLRQRDVTTEWRRMQMNSLLCLVDICRLRWMRRRLMHLTYGVYHHIFDGRVATVAPTSPNMVPFDRLRMVS